MNNSPEQIYQDLLEEISQSVGRARRRLAEVQHEPPN